jgi:hypothetical protein
MRVTLTDSPASYLGWARDFSPTATAEGVTSAAKKLRDWVHQDGSVTERALRLEALSTVELKGSGNTFSMEALFAEADTYLAFLKGAS